jgi:DNA-directed RNA polymerase subunit RPC12/RpoP
MPDEIIEREITCPYCGYQETESYEHEYEDCEENTQECGRCEREFKVVKTIQILYTTSAIPMEADNG